MIDVDGYTCHVVLGMDEYSLTARTCLKRPSDGYYAVGYVERIPFKGDEDKVVEELVTPPEELNFTTEDAANWEWRSTLQLAVGASKLTFANFEKWAADVPNQ